MVLTYNIQKGIVKNKKKSKSVSVFNLIKAKMCLTKDGIIEPIHTKASREEKANDSNILHMEDDEL